MYSSRNATVESRREADSACVEPSRPLPTPRWIVAGLAAFVAGLTVMVYWPVLDAQAVASDDRDYLHQNPLVHNPSWASVRSFVIEVREPSTVRGYYQPLAMISLMVDYALGGRPDNYRVFHVTSLVLHAACTLLVMAFLTALFHRPWAAACGALLFGLHPGAVESVAWVSDRKTLLATLFALGSLIAYVRYASFRSGSPTATSTPAAGNAFVAWYAASAVLFVLALMSKPTTTPLPLVMLLMDVWPLGRWSRRAVLEKAPFFALAAASAAITYISQLRAGDLASAGAYPAWATPLIVCHNIVFYLHKVLWPLSLSAHYPWPAPFSLMHPAVCVGLIGTLALLCGLILSLRWTRAFMVSWLMFFVSLLPAIGIVGFTVAIAADRFAYLPKVFLLPPIVWLLTRMGGQETESRMRSWAGAALIVLAAAGEAVSTRNYLVQWKDTESLARYQAHYAPQSAFVQTSLANILAGRGKWAEAADAYQKAIALENDAAAHSGLAAILADQGRVDEAELHLREAVRLYPSDVDSQANLAAILDRRGRPDEALTQIEKAVAAMPRSAGPYYQYAMILFRRGRLDEAAAQFQKALAIDPRDAYSLYQYGCLLLSRGNVADGVRQWEAALAIKPDWLELLNNLAWIWATSDDEEYRQPKRARRLARRACELTSNLDPSLLDTLAAAYAADFHFEDAVPAARLSIERWTALGNMQSAEQVRRRLELYEKRRPYREPVKSEAYRAK